MGEFDETSVEMIRGVWPDLFGIYRFGSAGTEFERKDSDLDLAVLPTSPLDSVQCWEVAQELATRVGRDVDLIDLLTASTVLQYQVITTGELIYCSDRRQCDAFDNRVRSQYLHFQEERAEIMEEIVRRGEILRERPTDDILVNKAATIERCLRRIDEEYRGTEEAFASNRTKQDSITLNIR